MPLANCKVELKLKWAKYYVFSAAVVDNGNGYDGDINISFIIKEPKLLSSCSFISHKQPKFIKTS